MANTIYKGAYLPQVAGDSAVWGGFLNTETFPTFDDALGGYAAIGVTAGSVSLTAAQDGMAILRVTGALSGNVVITSACQGFKYVENLTTNAFTVSIQNSVGSPLVLPQGYASIVIFDAANGARLGQSQPLPANGVFTGTLSVGGTATITGKLSLASTDSMAMANGTTAQRNGTPSAGDTRYNSTLGLLEYFNGTVWLQAAPVSIPGVQFLTINNNSVAPNTSLDITCTGQVIVTNSSGFALPPFANPGTITCNLATTGVNAMDTGTVTAGAPVYLYYISNQTLIKVLGSLTPPTLGGSSNLPAGYTFQCYAGAGMVDGSGNLYRTSQTGSDVCYAITAGTNTASYPSNAIASGASSWVLKGALVPVTASQVDIFSVAGNYNLHLYCGGNAAEAALGLRSLSYDGAQSFWSATGFQRVAFQGSDTKVYFSATTANGTVYLIGWKDRVNAT